MMHSIATVSISGTLEDKLTAIAQAGFEGVEIFENDLLAYHGSPKDIRNMIADHGLHCIAYQPFRDFEGMPDSMRAQIFDRARAKFEMMNELGTDTILVCSNTSPHSSNDRSRIIADFHELGEIAQQYGVKIAYEALAWGRHIDDHRQVWDIVKQTNHPAIGIGLDSFHSLAKNIPCESLREIDPQKIHLLQIADAPLMQSDTLSWSRHYRNMPGQGDLDIVNYVSTLIDIGFDGPISLEIFNDRFRAHSAKLIAQDGKRSLINLDDQCARLRDADTSPSPIKMPAPIDCSGVEFIEFTVSPKDVSDLGDFLSGLGFNKIGTHRNKDITLWRAGQVNIVLNTQKQSFAYAYDLLHDTSVCAIGLRVPNAQKAIDRARALKIDVFAKEQADQKISMPAIRSIGGSLIYFMEQQKCDQIWENEFDITKQAPETNLLRIDHIAQTVSYEEMPSWVLYFGALFNTTRTPQIEIPDPQGLVLSQAIENPDKSLRITLNASASSQTLSSRFLDSYMGAGIQHIAFEADDIFQAVGNIQTSQITSLNIPDNYYQDIKAKFALPDEIVKKMQAHNILYDQDEDGAYFQFYTRAFSKRFFFEIVQRIDYHAYGAPNAYIRLAAQSRHKEIPLHI